MQISLEIRFICLLLILYNNLSSQIVSNRYNIEWHSADDNTLPQNSVKSILQDKYGFIWMSTENGIVRYDGVNYLTFNNENISGLTSNRMYKFQGNINRDSIYAVNDYFEYIFINRGRILKVEKDKIPKKYYIDDDFYKYRKEFPKKLQSDKGYFLIKRQNISYHNFNNKILWKINFNTSKSFFFIFKDTLFAIDPKGNCICFFNGRINKTFLRDLHIKEKNLILNQASQQIFLKSGRNLKMFIVENGKPEFKSVLSDYDLSKCNIITAFFDNKNQILYLGSSTKGLLIIKKKNFKTLMGKDLDGVYYAQVAFSDSTLLSSSGSIFSNYGNSRLINVDSDNDEYNMMADRKGNVWIKSYNILFCYFKNTNYTTYWKWDFKDKITQIYQTRQNTIFIGTSKGKTITKKGNLYIYNEKGFFTSFMPLNFIPAYTVQREDNILWIGSDIGLHKVNIVKKQVENIQGLQNIQVRSIFSERNHIWVTTYNKGFFLYNLSDHKITKFPLDKNKYLASSHCIIKDRNDFFWISTNKGLFQTSMKTLLNYSAGKINDVYYHYYDKSEGFNTNEFNGGCQPCGVYLKNNYISFPSMNGIVIFNPDKIKPLLPNNNIFFEEAEIDNVLYPFHSDTLNLNGDFEKLRLFIRGPYYGNANNLKIEVKVDGPISQSWSHLHDNNITFTSLPFGTYKVTIRNLSDFDSKYIYSTKILIIPKKFWQTNLFKILGISFICSLWCYAFTLRIKYIKNKNIILEKKVVQRTRKLDKTIKRLKINKIKLKKEIENNHKLIATMTHDIKSPLQFLSILGKHIFQKMQKTKLTDTREESVIEDIQIMYTTSFQLYNFIDNLLEYTKISSKKISADFFSIYMLVEEKIGIFRNITYLKEVIIINRIEKDIFIYTNKLLLSIIIHNLIDNAVKNTSEGEIIFNVTVNNDKIAFTIHDTGQGMNEETVKFYSDLFINKKKQLQTNKVGIGFQMVSEILSLLEGEIKIKSQIGLGTEITITIKNISPCVS